LAGVMRQCILLKRGWMDARLEHVQDGLSASLPGLTRQSILFERRFAKADGCAGQARA
jgi:hypothetical protein